MTEPTPEDTQQDRKSMILDQLLDLSNKDTTRSLLLREAVDMVTGLDRSSNSSERVPPTTEASEPSTTSVRPNDWIVHDTGSSRWMGTDLSHRIAAIEERLAMMDAKRDIDAMESDEMPSSTMPWPDDVPQVIPHGYSMPSDNPKLLAMQYAEALNSVESLTHSLAHAEKNWRDFVVQPGLAVRYSMALAPIVGMIVEATRDQMNLGQAELEIPRHIAAAAHAFHSASSAETVAMGEFIDWALGFLSHAAESDERARMVKSNLEAVNLL